MSTNFFAERESGLLDEGADDKAIDTFIGDMKMGDASDPSNNLNKLFLSSDEEYLGPADDDEDPNLDGNGHLFFSSDDEDYDDSGVPIEDDFDDGYNFRDALRSAGNFKVRNKTRQETSSRSYWKRKMIRSTNRDLDPEVRHTLSLANEAFVGRDFAAAQSLYLEVIKKDPKNFSAYKTLGEICKHQGRLNDCCNYWLLAANLHPWHTAFWANVAELSADLGHIDQAIYCYTRAISPDTAKSARYILQRAVLYRDKKQYGRALEGFQRVHQLYPRDSAIVKNLASVYVEQKRLNDAINLYMRMLDYNVNPSKGNHEQEYPDFGWAELNILLELYIQQHTWTVAIKVTKIVARWIQQRSRETWWDDTDDDSEFDPKRRENIVSALSNTELREHAEAASYNLPIDIRFKLGVLRLNMDHDIEALHHLSFLLSESDGISDLFFEAGRALEETGHYEDALKFLTRASHSEELSDNSELVGLLGRCLLETGDYSQARQAFETLLYNDPGNLEHKLALAEALYHLGDADGARDLLQEVEYVHEQARNSRGQTFPQKNSPEPEALSGEDSEKLALIRNQRLIRSARSTKLSDSEKMEVETNAKRKVLDKYRRMTRLQDLVNAGDTIAIKAWMQLASQLIEMFMSVRSFFPRDRNRVFEGFVRNRHRNQMEIDDKIARVYNLYDGIVNDENYTRQVLTSKTEYRGLTYTAWFNIFTQYILLVAKHEDNRGYALEMVDVAMLVSVFAQDKEKESFLWFVKLVVGLQQGDSQGTVIESVRHFLISNQFSPLIYRLFMCCFASGVSAWEAFSSYNSQKFFLRQLKAFHSFQSGKKITGMAQITANVVGFKLEGENPYLLYLYANLLGGSRSYVSSIVYLNCVYREYKKDPMICLVLGLAHVHRSMQRLSSNRHIQLLQGISFLLEYRDLRLQMATPYETQEVEYNFGRLFHMLGLFSLAIGHYNKVLEFQTQGEIDPAYDLGYEAAYNLTLIYNISGNGLLARDITEKYLTV